MGGRAATGTTALLQKDQASPQNGSPFTPAGKQEIGLNISNESAAEMMTRCLKAVSLFLQGSKSFDSLVPYLKLALRLFVCLGVEGQKGVLGGRSLSEFVVYFLLQSLKSDAVVKLTRAQLQTFLSLYLANL